MKSEELVKIFNRDVIEGNLNLYRDLLDNTEEASDPVWKGILPIYINLSKEEKEVFIKFLKVVEINTLSHVLGILDGTNYIDNIKNDFILTTENNSEKLNEDLQSLFLELIKEER